MLRWRNSGERVILDFDIECRPLGWYGGDFVHKEITAIGCARIGTKNQALGMTTLILGEVTLEEMMSEFVTIYNKVDVVTGHFIRGFDLPTINMQLFELGMPLLEGKLAQCTKSDLVKFSGMSKSQENLGSVLGLNKPKVTMNQAKWREANRLTPEGFILTRKRVEGDVRQHIEMRARLLEGGYLGPPKFWESQSSGGGSYTP